MIIYFPAMLLDYGKIRWRSFRKPLTSELALQIFVVYVIVVTYVRDDCLSIIKMIS